MLEPLKNWYCDYCGKLIEKPEDGYLEWIDDDEGRSHSFKIVHHAPRSPEYPNGNCYHHDGARGRRDIALPTANRALIKLLSFIDIGPYHQPAYDGPRAKDLREWTEIARRLLLPYYEEARHYLPEADLGSPNEVFIYLPDTLRGVVQKYGNG